MKPPATARQRLILACAVGFGAYFLLSVLASLLWPHTGTLTPAGFIQPLTVGLLFVAMAAGGWTGGLRFVPWALGLLLVLLVLVTASLVALGLQLYPQQRAGLALANVLRTNALGFALQLAGAALGALLGAALRRWRVRRAAPL